MLQRLVIRLRKQQLERIDLALNVLGGAFGLGHGNPSMIGMNGMRLRIP